LRSLFIVTEDKLILGRDNMHSDLAEESDIDRKDILGGGAFEQKGPTHFILYGESHDFGRFNVATVQKHIKNEDYYWYTEKYADFTFEYDLEREETIKDEF